MERWKKTLKIKGRKEDMHKLIVLELICNKGKESAVKHIIHFRSGFATSNKTIYNVIYYSYFLCF